MTILSKDTKSYTGKKIKAFQDEHGNNLQDLIMVETLVIVFEDGEKIVMSPDYRGSTCYFSQVD